MYENSYCIADIQCYPSEFYKVVQLPAQKVGTTYLIEY